MHYRLIGKTYACKEDLKSLACRWEASEKCWVTPWMTKDELAYKRIKSLSEAFEFDMVPSKLHSECQKIQEIINKGSVK